MAKAVPVNTIKAPALPLSADPVQDAVITFSAEDLAPATVIELVVPEKDPTEVPIAPTFTITHY